MGLIIGPTPWWQANIVAACPEATTLPDGSRIICKAGGTAWIVAPSCTQVGEYWGNVTACGCIDNSPAGVSIHSDITSENFPVLYNRLISCGFNPGDWFVPSTSQLQNPGYVCRTNWDSFSAVAYWSSTEISATSANIIGYSGGAQGGPSKTSNLCVRAFRCVTY